MFTASSYAFYDDGLFHLDPDRGDATVTHPAYIYDVWLCWHSKAWQVRSREAKIPFDSEHDSSLRKGERETGENFLRPSLFRFGLCHYLKSTATALKISYTYKIQTMELAEKSGTREKLQCDVLVSPLRSTSPSSSYVLNSGEDLKTPWISRIWKVSVKGIFYFFFPRVSFIFSLTSRVGKHFPREESRCNILYVELLRRDCRSYFLIVLLFAMKFAAYCRMRCCRWLIAPRNKCCKALHWCVMKVSGVFQLERVSKCSRQSALQH